jgi:hypothetical protein
MMTYSMLSVWAICVGLSMMSCDMAELDQLSHQKTVINNNLFRYGMYCGPGPDDKLWSTTVPVDSIDQICQDHDKAYRGCLESLSKDAGES